MDRVRLLGIPIDPLTAADVLIRLKSFLSDGRQHHVMTPNSEMLVAASKDEPFRALLNRTDLNIPDSQGLLYAARWTGQYVPERVTGVDTVQAFCATLTKDVPVFLLGAAPGVAEAAAETLKRRNPGLNIAGTFAGSPTDEDASDILQRITMSGAQVLFVAYGAPKQDMWIDKHLKELPSVKIAMGVGGTFDFLAGVQKRAPSFFRSLGLEWLWRVVREPKRIGRIVRAVVVFPVLVMRYGNEGK